MKNYKFNKYLIFFPAGKGFDYKFMSIPVGEKLPLDDLLESGMGFSLVWLSQIAWLLTVKEQLPEKLTSKKIEALVGLKANTLHYYIEAGVIFPDIDPGSGTGTVRLFSATNLIEAEILQQLIRFQLPKRVIVDVFRKIKVAGERDQLDPRVILGNEQRKNFVKNK